MTNIKFALILLSNLILVATLGFVVYLYADILFFSDGSPDKGYNLFHLIATVPYPLIGAAVLSLIANRPSDEDSKRSVMIKLFPFGSFILTVGQFLILSLNNALSFLCVLISVLLFVTSIALLVYETLNGLKKVRHPA